MNNGEFYLADAIEVIDEVLEGGGEFRIYPKGTSMLPLIRQGRDSVVLRRRIDRSIKRHDIAFYRRSSGAFVLHRVMRVLPDGSCVMCGDNQTNLERNVSGDRIIGYVSSVYRDDVPVPVSSGKYRAYTALWCFMPLRRAVRLCQRIFGAVKRKIFKKK